MEVFRNIKIANWFLEVGVQSGKPLSQMHLQKLIYFAHALSLAQSNIPLVTGSFEAWQYGPVLPDLYAYTKGWGSMEKIVVLGYEVLLGWDSGDKIYMAQCPLLVGCMTHGITQEEAANEMKTAIREHLKLAKEIGRSVPDPIRVYA